MPDRYQIVVSARRSSASADRELGFWSRFKAALVGIGFLVISAGVLVVALIFGSIVAAVLWVCLVVVIAAVIVKNAWQK